VSAWFVWMLVGLGLAAVAARRPAAAAMLVAGQTLLVGVGALVIASGRSAEFAAAAALLLVKALVVTAIVAAGIARVRESRPPQDEPGLLVRLGGAVALVLVMVELLPAYGLESRALEDAAAAMLATGLAMALVRRATLFAVLAFLVAENGIALAAVSVAGGLPLVVELGIAFDLVVLLAVAAVFQRRILTAFGTTDSDALRDIRG
jgi:hydrogenase-4 component E